MWGEEPDPALLSTVPGGYRNPLVSALGVRPAEILRPNQGSRGPRCRAWGAGVALETVGVWPGSVLGIVWVSPMHVGQEPVPGDPLSALYLQCVSSPLRSPASELRVLPWLTRGPFSSLHLVAFILSQAALSGFLLCILLRTFGVSHYCHNISHI